jgi:hypothetical protein
MEGMKEMNQRNLRYINVGFMGLTLFITLLLVNNFPSLSFYFAELFIILNMIKDIIMHKIGFTFNKTGIKEMIVVDIILLIFFVSYHIYSINNQGSLKIY